MEEITPEEHQYVLHAVWNDDQGHTAHRVIHSTWPDPWDPKAIINNYITMEHPQWLPEGVGQIGYVSDKVRVGDVQVFKVIDCDLEAAFKEWRTEAEEARMVVDKKRMYAADMATIKALQMKWGLNGEHEREV